MKKVDFEVWALGYDRDGMASDLEEFLGKFHDRRSAITHALKFKDISYVFTDADNFLDDGEYLEIRVETVKKIDSIYQNIDTIYSANIY